MKKLGLSLTIIGVIILFCVSIGIYYSNLEIRTIKNEKDLQNTYESYGREMSLLEQMLLLPFSVMVTPNRYRKYYYADIQTNGAIKDEESASTPKNSNEESTRDYSKTNIQVEGVDEADYIKTDGNYIYSLSENEVIITNVEDKNNPKVEATIKEGSSIPTDLILYKNKLVVISTKQTIGSIYNSNTLISIYDTENKEKPKLVKSVELHEPYYTTRCIDGNLYVFSKGYLREKNDKIDRKYKINSITKEIPYNKIKYINHNRKNTQTLITEVDLNNINKDVNVSSYLFDINNAYISKNNIYLLKTQYENELVKVKDLFTLKGVFGIFKKTYTYDSYDYTTHIYKFSIDKKEGIKYLKNTSVKGETINQYSLDEKDGNLRIALDTQDGTQIVILDKMLNKIGETDKVAEGEKMYASRFMGDKAYLVTFKNTDPLFVIDLSDPKNPEVLGELKIPGYSTYLHPYDENHLIGIGIDTDEVVHRDYTGRMIGTWTEILGMKMALFDVTDVNNPEEIDSVKIGDKRTVSAVLSNPKALLFSKEKNLIAIPVNNYKKDYNAKSYDDNIASTIVDYSENIGGSYSDGNLISEGYLVYNIDLKGFNQKGIITHDKKTYINKYNTKDINNFYTYMEYAYNSRLLRGLYIDDNLYTVSEDYVKVNKIEDLSEINSLDLKGEE